MTPVSDPSPAYIERADGRRGGMSHASPLWTQTLEVRYAIGNSRVDGGGGCRLWRQHNGFHRGGPFSGRPSIRGVNRVQTGEGAADRALGPSLSGFEGVPAFSGRELLSHAL